TYEPEDTPIADTFAGAVQHPNLILEHLDALRRHLLRAILFLVITTTFSFAFAQQLLEFLTRPLGGLSNLQSIEVTENIGVFMRVSLLAGFALAFPYIAFELFAFVQSGLHRRSRLMVALAIPSATVLFLTGMAFAFFVMMPAAIPFLVSFLNIPVKVRPSSYINFVTGLLFWIGVAFQMPLVIYFLARLGVVRARQLGQQWRIAVVGIAILAAAVTPTVDPVNMALVMAPMIVLYFLSIGLAAVAERQRKR
ncbi:MAG: twin-arginine translocase subunit TatC, partial [Chloroflexi bacterium]|nr:twin-arginine translocase subunit TatC [Chloroflexota bacterium]